MPEVAGEAPESGIAKQKSRGMNIMLDPAKKKRYHAGHEKG
jgi:hypothetical protein